MKQIKLVSLLAVGVLTATACADQEAVTPLAPDAGSASFALQSSGRLSLGVDRGVLRLPSSARISGHYSVDAVGAINGSDYICPASTPISDWFDAEFGRVIEEEFDIIYPLVVDLAADQIPQLEALYFQTEDSPQYFGYNGEHTKVLKKTERDAKRFWDIPSDDIQLIGMHGSMLLDEARVARVYEALFTTDDGEPISPELAALLASEVSDLMQQSETMNGGNHPLFSFNAFAISAPGFIPDKIVMGDGILAGYDVLGFGDVAPQAVFAHEFAHHIQYENGYFDDEFATAGDAPEQARYPELMADAMSAYYLTHKRGATLNRKRVAQFLEVFYQIGDCGFTSSGHHGTPNQRMAAAQFGFDVADQAQKQGHILTSEQFHDLFVAAYPGIVAPDAT